MSLTVRRATEADFGRVLKIYEGARKFMREHGNGAQWGEDRPTAEEISSDITDGVLYAISDGTELCAVFALVRGGEPYYADIEGEWLTDAPCLAVHRVASSFGRRGMLHEIMQFAKAQCGHLKIDTHADNYVMQNALSREGFVRRGWVTLPDGQRRIAYEFFARG